MVVGEGEVVLMLGVLGQVGLVLILGMMLTEEMGGHCGDFLVDVFGEDEVGVLLLLGEGFFGFDFSDFVA